LKESSRIQATLEGRDGCAGEFYEYLDHTADVQFHVWGKTLEEAFANMAPCMFNFITELGKLEIGNESDPIELEVSGHDWHSLLFAYMDEMLFNFATDGFCSVKVDIKEFDRENFRIKANM
jgi:SHS2 domain-containing protein